MRASFLSLVIAVLLLASASAVAGQSGRADAELPVPTEADFFVGTSTCRFSGTSTYESVDGVAHVAQPFTCATDTTDPRASGTEEVVYVTRKIIDAVHPWSAEGVFTTEEASWRGSGEGIVDIGGTSPLGSRGFGFNYGEMTYVGEGAYEGLVMHYYLAGHMGNLSLAGWVVPPAE